MECNVHYAKTNLSKLIDAARRGEEVVITFRGKPNVRIVAFAPPRFKFGVLDGELGAGPDFLEPMSDEDLCLWEARND